MSKPSTWASSQLIAEGKAWVLSRMYYDVSRLPAEDQQVTVRTWSRGTDGLFAFREFQLIDAQGVAVSCTSYWVIIDLNTRHVLLMHDLIDGFETHPDMATDHRPARPPPLPRKAPEPIMSASFPVRALYARPHQPCQQCRIHQMDFRQPAEGLSHRTLPTVDIEYQRNPPDETIHRLRQPDVP